ncbi:hypothetical protein ACU4GD_23585 [Cupriavidus basilensis]
MGEGYTWETQDRRARCGQGPGGVGGGARAAARPARSGWCCWTNSISR